MKLITILALVAFAAFFGTAYAEGGCPQGEYPQEGPGWRTCIPFPASQSTNQPSTGTFENRWGAIAIDAQRGVMGTALEARSESSARSAALTNCESKGGKSCEVKIRVANGCMAMTVTPDGVFTDGAGSKSEVESKGLQHCGGHSSGKCGIYYSGCSAPVFVN
ncbi:DUF4189 domain-containing protein [Luteibacter yeojuensis]|uniref:DUF4189 domain-containing protein n=1 Tax=Luteibacter yeojuensis TaxID=345309 RepID=UPI0009FFFB76|nr:DUF4189 domain-containing protein [Luteibacter yeojuensis]